MSSDAEVRVSVIAQGAERVLRALRGIVDASRRADEDSSRSHQRTTRERVRGDQQAERSARRVSETRRSESKRAAEEERRHMHDLTREEERSTRERQRMRARTRGAGRGGGGGGILGDVAGSVGIPLSIGAGVGLATGALSQVVQALSQVANAMGANAGVQDTGQRTVTAQNFELELTRMGGEVFGGLNADERSAELQRLQQEILGIAQATNQSPGVLLESLASLQTEFSAFEFGRENLQAMAQEATRTGTEMQTIARFAGLVNQQMGEIDTETLLNITAQGGLQGALDPESLASAFGGQLGLFQTFVDPRRSASSEQNTRSFVATANVLRQSGLGANESATLMQNMFSSLSRANVQRDIRRRTGVDIREHRDEQGRLDIGGFVESLESSGRFGDLESISRVVKDQQASQALNTLIQARTRNRLNPEANADIRELEQVSAEQGGAFRAQNLAEVLGTSAMQTRAIAVAGEKEGIESLAERGARGEGALQMQEALINQGFVGEMIANNLTVTTGLGALLGEAALSRQQVQAVAEGPGPGLGGITEAAGIGRTAGDVVDPVGALVNVIKNAFTEAADRQAVARDQQATRLAALTGQEVGRALADAPNPEARRPGGPSARRP